MLLRHLKYVLYLSRDTSYIFNIHYHIWYELYAIDIDYVNIEHGLFQYYISISVYLHLSNNIYISMHSVRGYSTMHCIHNSLCLIYNIR